MRLALIVAGILLHASTSRSDDAPTADERAAIGAIQKVGGKAAIDPKLPPAARVAAKFEGVTDAAIVALKNWPQVGAVELFNSPKCTVKTFVALKVLPNLRQLVVEKVNLTAACVTAIGECKELRHLGLVNVGLMDTEISGLKSLKLLEHLSLADNPKVTDVSMATVKNFDRLRALYLGKTLVGDKGLASLKVLDGLRTLNVVGSNVTAEAADTFADDMPNLRGVRW